MFVKNETLREADTMLKLLKIDFTDSAIFKQAVGVGIGAALHISTYKKSPSVKQHKVTQFHTDAQKLLWAIMPHMLEKSQLKYPLARYAASMNPCILVQSPMVDVSILRFTKMLEKLVIYKGISTKEANDAKQEHINLLNSVVPVNKEQFLAFNKFSDRLDSFYKEVPSLKDFVTLWKVFKMIFCLFHRQSGVEQGFNTNEGFSVENPSEICLKALRMVHDHMRAKETAPHSIKIHKDFRKSVGIARKRAAEIALTRKDNKVVSESELKRKIVSEEIQDFKAKNRFFTSACNLARKRIL